MATQWGRNERLVWAPHAPIFSYLAVAGAVLCAVLFIWESYAFQQPEIRKAYTSEYIRASVGAQFHQHGKYRLLYLGGPGRDARLALPDDFVEGMTLLPSGSSVPVMLSPEARAQGYEVFYRAPSQSYSDTSMHRWLRAAIFHGHSLLDTYALQFGESLFLLVLALALAGPRDMRRLKELKYGRLLKGPVMLTPKQFNKTLKGTGIGITTDERNTILRIPEKDEAKHIQVMGDTGAGKTTLLRQMLLQIQERGESAIVYDPAGEFIQRFYNEKRGDIVLNPMDERCPYWSPSSELRTPAEARTIAASLYQPTDRSKSEFFVQTPQKVFARLLLYRPTPRQLAEWMANEEEIDKRVEGTPMKSMIARGAEQQRNGVLGSLGLVADGLMLLPTKEQATREWSATEWSEKREGWIFLSGKKSEREALRPLHSLWIDLLILRLLELPKPGQKRAWFVLDEVASLQRLPQFHTALTEGRKSDNPIVFGYQGKAQVEDTYDRLAEVMLSQPATKFIMKTGEPKAAKWASELIGEIEIERMKETHVHGNRHGKTFTIDRQIEPLVMGSEIEGLADLHTFVKLGNYVSRFSFPHMDLPEIAPAFIPRESTSELTWLDAPPAAPQKAPESAVLVQDPETASPAAATPAPAPEPKAIIQPDTLTPELQARLDALLADFDRRMCSASESDQTAEPEQSPASEPPDQQHLFPEPPAADLPAAPATLDPAPQFIGQTGF